MVFCSIEFISFFLPLLFIVYFIVPKKFRGIRNFVLLIFSIIFYGWGGPKFIILMTVSVIINYICGIFASRRFNKNIRIGAVFLAVFCGIGLLCYFKYMGFLAEIINSVGISVPIPKITLPIGISFYTFQGLSYVIDVYRGETKVQRNPLRLALYISLFPQLVAGPIVRYSTVEEEIGNRHENIKDFSDGVIRFMFGFAKKMLIANSMGIIADNIFAQTLNLSASLAWVGAIAYTFQIYFDFSAYSDMAIGLGKMFGFHFLENFNYPYISKTVGEFWRRWHISLSTWFRDYVYIPLGGNRKGKKMHIINLFVVWFLTGLWHGASWNFIIWGLWFFVILICEKFIWGNILKKLPSIIGHIYTMIIVIISWVFFRSINLIEAIYFIKAMFGRTNGFWDSQTLYWLIQYKYEFIAAIIFSMPIKNIFYKGFLIRRKKVFFRFSLNWCPVFIALILFIYSYIELVSGSFNPFIYFRF